jgi:hypothetical protein
MVSHRRDVIRDTPRCECRRRVVRHKDHENFRAHPNAKSVAQTSKTLDEEGDTYAIACCFCRTKKSYADSISDAEKQIKTQKDVSYSNTNRVTVRDRNAVCQSRGNAGTCSGKEGLAERFTVA